MSFASEIPYGAYWSTPFAKWQGALQHQHSLKFAASVAMVALQERRIDTTSFDWVVLGMTIPQHQSFYGTPWFSGLVGAPQATGPTISQACATGARCLINASQEIDSGGATSTLVVACDRTSNGAHLYYPQPAGIGGTGVHEDWVLDNFMHEPLGGHSMLQTAENVAQKHQITTAEQHDVVLRRYEQYQDALKDDHAFQKRYMKLPFPVMDEKGRKQIGTLEGDEGVFATSPSALAKLKPVMKEGTVTFGGQTHPADGNAGLVLATPEKAREMSRDPGIRIRIKGYGQSRVDLAYMPEAPIPAAQAALRQANVKISDIAAIKSHNPFAVNDIVFSRATGCDLNSMNNYGCSLIWGHPQAPTGLRAIIELIEELVLRGGGLGLFHGCAAGDSSVAVVIEVSGARA